VVYALIIIVMNDDLSVSFEAEMTLNKMFITFGKCWFTFSKVFEKISFSFTLTQFKH